MSNANARSEKRGEEPDASALATLTVARAGDEFRLIAAGQWLITAAESLDRRLREIDAGGAKSVKLDLSGITALDTAGAWLLQRTRHVLAQTGRSVELRE